jgi:hypothetical protein
VRRRAAAARAAIPGDMAREFGQISLELDEEQGPGRNAA